MRMRCRSRFDGGLITEKVPKSYPFESMIGGDRSAFPSPGEGRLRSVPFARGGREIFLILAFLALMLVGVGRRFPLAGDVRPFCGETGVDLEHLLEASLGVGEDR